MDPAKSPMWGIPGDTDPIATAVFKDIYCGNDEIASVIENYSDTTLLQELGLLEVMNCDDKKQLIPFQMPSSKPMIQGDEVLEEGNYMKNDHYNFVVEESSKVKNKPYKIENNFVTSMPNEAIRIRAVGAQNGHIVKVTVRYKEESLYQQPIKACNQHNRDSKPNQNGTFHVVPKDCNVMYVEEDGHNTAIVEPSEMAGDGFVFSPMFRCLNSCNGQRKDMQLNLQLCDSTRRVLHKSSIDYRICKNVLRDAKQEPKCGKRRRSSAQALAYKQAKLEADKSFEAPQEAVIDQLPALIAPPSTGKIGTYLVQLDENYFPLLEALSKMGAKLVKVNPTLVPNRNY